MLCAYNTFMEGQNLGACASERMFVPSLDVPRAGGVCGPLNGQMNISCRNAMCKWHAEKGHTYCIDMHRHTCKHTYNHAYTCIHTHNTYVHTLTCIHTCTYAYMHIHAHTYIHTYVHMHVCAYACIHINTHIYTQAHTHSMEDGWRQNEAGTSLTGMCAL